VRAFILLLAFTSSGCGYALAGRGSFLPDYIMVVGIPQFENRSSFSQVEQILTDKVRTEFIGRGKYTVVPEAAGSDAVLSGEVLAVSVGRIATGFQHGGSNGKRPQPNLPDHRKTWVDDPRYPCLTCHAFSPACEAH